MALATLRGCRQLNETVGENNAYSCCITPTGQRRSERRFDSWSTPIEVRRTLYMPDLQRLDSINVEEVAAEVATTSTKHRRAGTKRVEGF